MMVVNEWRYLLLGEEFGPVTTEALHDMIAQGVLGPDDQVRCGNGDWRRVADIPRAREAMPVRPLAKTSAPTTRRESSQPAWFVQLAGRELGPIDHADLKQLSAEGRITPSDRVREGVDGKWFRAATVPGLFAEQDRTRAVAGQASLLAEKKSTTTSTTLAVQSPPPAPQTATAPPLVMPAARPTPMPPPAASIQPSSPAPVLNRSTPVAPLATAAPRVSAPYTPPRPSHRASRSSRVGWSSLFSFSGEQIKQGLAVAAVIAVVAGLWFGRGLFGPAPVEPKSAEFCELSLVWSRVVDLQDVGDAPEQWQALQRDVLPKLDELRTRATVIASGGGEDAILAEQILKMVDVAEGPTKTEGLLRRIVSSGGKPKPMDLKQAVDVMTKAAQLVHGA